MRIKLLWCDTCDDMRRHVDGQCVAGIIKRGIPRHGSPIFTCTKCKRKLPFTAFGKRGDKNIWPLRPSCKGCGRLARTRYEHTFGAMVRMMYVRIKRRCTGKTKDTWYHGLPFMGRKQFLEIAMNDKNLRALYDAYVLDGRRNFKIAPSVHRIKPALGYVRGNIAFITMSENSKEQFR